MTASYDYIHMKDDQVITTKKDLFKSVSIDLLDTQSRNEIEILKNSVLSSWFKDVDSYVDFEKKFSAFSELLDIRDIQMLFKIVTSIPKIEFLNPEDRYLLDEPGFYSKLSIRTDIIERIRQGQDTYKYVTGMQLYKELSHASGYKLSKDFAIMGRYLDKTLHKKVLFTRLMYNELINIDKRIKTKGTDEEVEKVYKKIYK